VQTPKRRRSDYGEGLKGISKFDEGMLKCELEDWIQFSRKVHVFTCSVLSGVDLDKYHKSLEKANPRCYAILMSADQNDNEPRKRVCHGNSPLIEDDPFLINLDR